MNSTPRMYKNVLFSTTSSSTTSLDDIVQRGSTPALVVTVEPLIKDEDVADIKRFMALADDDIDDMVIRDTPPNYLVYYPPLTPPRSSNSPTPPPPSHSSPCTPQGSPPQSDPAKKGESNQIVLINKCKWWELIVTLSLIMIKSTLKRGRIPFFCGGGGGGGGAHDDKVESSSAYEDPSTPPLSKKIKLFFYLNVLAAV
ncbi:unnamed protein product [Lactuca saligna]|uniref:Uncharacterized protein n=1 Tax=Lactuca saligna TaxID=75948 RepID=A0AA36E3R2_LACSI|nr:unnamed protein product [Lactuca saligna]